MEGEAEVSLSLGFMNTSWNHCWNIVVVENLQESVLGADFIENRYSKSRGVTDNRLHTGYPLQPVIAKCAVNLPARHQK